MCFYRVLRESIPQMDNVGKIVIYLDDWQFVEIDFYKHMYLH